MFYSESNAQDFVKMLLRGYFAILFIIFELIDKAPVGSGSISRNDIFLVFLSILARESVWVQL